jgi:hypothetical protein
MSWERYPNANYPEPWDEANMVKATDVATNEDGGSLVVDAVGAGNGPLQITADMVPDRTEEAVVEEETE